MSRQYIIAGGYLEYKQWLNKLYDSPDYFPGATSGYIYVQDVSHLKGIRNPRGRFIGTWYKRPDLDQIILQLLMSGGIDSNKHDEIITTRDKLNGVQVDLNLYGIKSKYYSIKP